MINKPQRIIKVWGYEEIFHNTDHCCKKLVVNQQHQCSEHFHREKNETFYLVCGLVYFTLDSLSFYLEQGKSITVRKNQHHKFLALKDSEIIEASTPHSEGDSFRVSTSKKLDDITFKKLVKGYDQ